MLRLFTFFATCAFTTALHAQTVYKCSADGKTSYADRPCPQGASHALPPPTRGISAADTMGPQGGDARTLLEIEKLRIARDREQARSQARADREQARGARGVRAAQAKRQKCDKLRLRRKWTEEDLARAVHGPAHEALRTKLRRQMETLAVECPA